MRDKQSVIRSIVKCSNLSYDNASILYDLMDKDKNLQLVLAIKKQLQYAKMFRLDIKLMASISRVINGEMNNVVKPKLKS